jgi:ubiquinone biosynthesis protein UbiJ
VHYLFIQQAINYLVESGSINIDQLNGKTARFSILDLRLNVDFVCNNDRVHVLSGSNIAPDVDIKLSMSVFIALFQGEDLTELLRQDKIVINGDVKTAQLIVDLLNNADIDLEEELSKYTGDIVAHKVGTISKKFIELSAAASTPLEAIKEGLIKILVRPSTTDRYKNKNI